MYWPNLTNYQALDVPDPSARSKLYDAMWYVSQSLNSRLDLDLDRHHRLDLDHHHHHLDHDHHLDHLCHGALSIGHFGDPLLNEQTSRFHGFRAHHHLGLDLDLDLVSPMRVGDCLNCQEQQSTRGDAREAQYNIHWPE
jgi:hypothetical protein